MHLLLSLIEQYGLALVFAHVLVEQLGVPLPAWPTMIVTGAVAARGDYSPVQVVAVAVVASVLADLAWYAAGARAGRTVLRLMCRVSLSPDGCVRQTESIYERWGPPSLMIAKFVPGFAAVATAMAGVVRTRLASFVLYDAIGALLWSGAAVAVGWMFRDAINEVLDVLETTGRWGLLAILVAFAAFVLFRAWQRHAFQRELRMARVSVDDLNDMLGRGERPLVIDVRTARSLEHGRIPGALWIDSHAIDESLKSLPPADEVIVYCACPNEASAAALAKRLIGHGFTRVRPLAGGIDAWIEAGYALEPAAEPEGEPRAGSPARRRPTAG